MYEKTPQQTKNVNYIRKTSMMLSYSRPIPAQKMRENSVPGAVFSHIMPKIDFNYIRIVLLGKNTLN